MANLNKVMVIGNLTKDPAVIAVSLIAFALVLLWAERTGRRARREQIGRSGA